jgi:hypothetical protein
MCDWAEERNGDDVIREEDEKGREKGDGEELEEGFAGGHSDGKDALSVVGLCKI